MGMFGGISSAIGKIAAINEMQMAKIGPILNSAVNSSKFKAAMQNGMGGVDGALQEMIKKNISGVSAGQMEGMTALMKAKLTGAVNAAAGGAKGMAAAAKEAMSEAGGAASGAAGAASSAAGGAAGGISGAVKSILDPLNNAKQAPVIGGAGGGSGMANLAGLQKAMAGQQAMAEQLNAMMQAVHKDQSAVIAGLR